MEPKSHCKFIFRLLALISASLLAQLPSSYRVHFDREMFLKAMTADLPDGKFCADGYTLGPNGYLHEVDEELERRRYEVKKKILVDCYEHHCPAIPDVISLRSSDRESLQTRRIAGRPRATNHSEHSGNMPAIKKKSGIDTYRRFQAYC